MKRFLFLIAMTLALASPSQTFDHNLLGMEEPVFNAANGVIFTQKTNLFLEIVPTQTTRNGVVTRGNTIRWNKNTSVTYNGRGSQCGIYGLNLMHDYIHSYNFTYDGVNDTSMVFSTKNQEAYWSENNGRVIFTVVTHPDRYTSVRNDPANPSRKTFVHFTRNQVDSLCQRIWKIDILEMERRSAMRFYGEYRDPATNMVSFFPYASIENGKVINKTFINGKPYDTVNLSNLRTANNRTGFSFMFKWRYLNGCALSGTSSGDMAGIGNMGECGASDWLERFDSKSQSVSFTTGPVFTNNKITNTVQFQLDKPKYIILYLGEKPISGKESSNVCYVNIDTGLVSTFPS